MALGHRWVSLSHYHLSISYLIHGNICLACHRANSWGISEVWFHWAVCTFLYRLLNPSLGSGNLNLWKWNLGICLYIARGFQPVIGEALIAFGEFLLRQRSEFLRCSQLLFKEHTSSSHRPPPPLSTRPHLISPALQIHTCQ